MMKKVIFIFVLLVALNLTAQVRPGGFDSPRVQDGIVNQNSGNLFGFMNSENFSMNHSFDLSYQSFGSNGLALGVYTNSMMYKFSDKLNIQTDLSIVQSPYSSFGKNFQNNINGIYLSKAALNFKPYKDMFITIQYRNLPFTGYSSYNGMFNRTPFGHDDFFWGN